MCSSRSPPGRWSARTPSVAGTRIRRPQRRSRGRSGSVVPTYRWWVGTANTPPTIRTTPNIVPSGPRIRPRIRSCDGQPAPDPARSSRPVANAAMTARCDGPYIVNCWSPNPGSVNWASKILDARPGSAEVRITLRASCSNKNRKTRAGQTKRTMSDTEVFPADLLDTGRPGPVAATRGGRGAAQGVRDLRRGARRQDGLTRPRRAGPPARPA